MKTNELVGCNIFAFCPQILLNMYIYISLLCIIYKSTHSILSQSSHRLIIIGMPCLSAKKTTSTLPSPGNSRKDGLSDARRRISIKTTRKASTFGWFKKSTILVWSDTDWSGNCFFLFLFCMLFAWDFVSKTANCFDLHYLIDKIFGTIFNALNMFYNRDARKLFAFNFRFLILANKSCKCRVQKEIMTSYHGFLACNMSRLRSLHALVKEKVNDLGETLQSHLVLFERETPILKTCFFLYKIWSIMEWLLRTQKNWGGKNQFGGDVMGCKTLETKNGGLVFSWDPHPPKNARISANLWLVKWWNISIHPDWTQINRLSEWVHSHPSHVTQNVKMKNTQSLRAFLLDISFHVSQATRRDWIPEGLAPKWYR